MAPLRFLAFSRRCAAYMYILMTNRLTCSDELAVTLVLGLDEIWQNILVAPSNGSEIHPVIVVVPAASQVLHVVEVARATEASTKRPVALLQSISNASSLRQYTGDNVVITLCFVLRPKQVSSDYSTL